MGDEEARAVLCKTTPKLTKQLPFVATVPRHRSSRFHLIGKFQQADADDRAERAVECRLGILLVFGTSFFFGCPSSKEIEPFSAWIGVTFRLRLADKPFPFLPGRLIRFNIENDFHEFTPSRCKASMIG